MAECGDPPPEGPSVIAAISPLLDVVGIKVGMKLEDALAALKLHDATMTTDVRELELKFTNGKSHSRPYLVLASNKGNRDQVSLLLSQEPGPSLVLYVERSEKFEIPRPLQSVIAALEKKYGTSLERTDTAGVAITIDWFYDRWHGRCFDDARHSVTRMLTTNGYMYEVENPAGVQALAMKCGAHVRASMLVDRRNVVTEIMVRAIDERLRAQSILGFRTFLSKLPPAPPPKL
jgi:hypothetical protein